MKHALLPPLGDSHFYQWRQQLLCESLKWEPFDKMQTALQEAERQMSVNSYFHINTMCFPLLRSCAMLAVRGGHALEVIPA